MTSIGKALRAVAKKVQLTASKEAERLVEAKVTLPDGFDPKHAKPSLQSAAVDWVGKLARKNGAYQQLLTQLDRMTGGKEDASSDGALIGAFGQRLPAGPSFAQLPGVRPSSGAPPTGKVLFVNGAGTNESAHWFQMRALADKTGAEVVGLHNATQGFGHDLDQMINDEAGSKKNPAVRGLSDLVLRELWAGRPLRVVGHSQGASITAAALRDVSQRLRAQGLSAAEVKERLGLVQVDTLGGVGTHYPDGPKYTHYVNDSDLAPQLVGLRPDTHYQAGAGAEVRRFKDNRGNVVENHDLPTYLDHLAWP